MAYARNSFLESLPGTDRAALLEIGRRREWQKGEALVHARDRANSAIVLVGGLVKIHKIAAEGADVLLALCGPGDLLGEITAVRDAVRSASATAVTPVQARVIPVGELRTFLAAHPRATLALLDLTLGRLYDSDERRIEFATAESLARVSSRLVELAERFGEHFDDGVVEVALPISQEELASWSGSSRESSARALRTLRDLGLIQTQRMRLRVLDLDRLRAHAARL
jgi:CRP/FNR family transcriptional regulator, cyclic AMP receptor protein